MGHTINECERSGAKLKDKETVAYMVYGLKWGLREEYQCLVVAVKKRMGWIKKCIGVIDEEA